MATAAIILMALASCEKDLPTWSDETCRLNFYYSIDDRSTFKAEMAESSYSFAYGETDRTRDTIWFKVETMGKVSSVDRSFTLTQVDTTLTMAVAGKHYVAFDDPEVSSYYVIKAGKAQADIPVILLRDASLKTDLVCLKFKITPDGNFTNGYPEYQTKAITFSDFMTQPSKWSYDYEMSMGSYKYTVRLSDYLGDYGQVKHHFLIEQTGKDWDDDYIDELMLGDSNYMDYIIRKLVKALDALNAERAAQGLGPLTEDDGTVVEFPYAQYM